MTFRDLLPLALPVATLLLGLVVGYVVERRGRRKAIARLLQNVGETTMMIGFCYSADATEQGAADTAPEKGSGHAE